jgi:hypothetical protein
MYIIDVLIAMIQCILRMLAIFGSSAILGLVILFIIQVTIFWTFKVSLYSEAIKEAKKFIKKYEIF